MGGVTYRRYTEEVGRQRLLVWPCLGTRRCSPLQLHVHTCRVKEFKTYRTILMLICMTSRTTGVVCVHYVIAVVVLLFLDFSWKMVVRRNETRSPKRPLTDVSVRASTSVSVREEEKQNDIKLWKTITREYKLNYMLQSLLAYQVKPLKETGHPVREGNWNSSSIRRSWWRHRTDDLARCCSQVLVGAAPKNGHHKNDKLVQETRDLVENMYLTLRSSHWRSSRGLFNSFNSSRFSCSSLRLFSLICKNVAREETSGFAHVTSRAGNDAHFLQLLLLLEDFRLAQFFLLLFFRLFFGDLLETLLLAIRLSLLHRHLVHLVTFFR